MGVRLPIINERFLTQFIKVLSSSHDFTRKSLNNFYKLISSIDKEFYKKDVNTHAMILTIEVLILARLEGENDTETFLSRVQIEVSDTYLDVKENIIYPTIISSEDVADKDIRFIERTIETYIKYNTVLSKKDEILDTVTDISSGNINNLPEAITSLRTLISNLNDEFKITDVNTDRYTMAHTIQEEFIEDILKETFDYYTSPKLVLKTGLKRFNEMLSRQGGFLGGKFYMFHADTNTFKSALLLYIAKWIQKYNSHVFLEDFLHNKKRPTILYISLENAYREDASRYFSAYTQTNISSYSDFSDIKSMWTKNYNITNSIIDITLLHAEDNTFGIKDLKNAIVQLEDEGYVVITVLLDSFDLLAPLDEDKFNDERIQLTKNGKAIQKFIKERPFPLISVHQMNREGNKSTTEKREKGAINIGKALGRQYISGAYDIERRVSFSAYLYIETSPYDNKEYLEISRGKMRYEKTDIDFFAHELKNGFYIEDDYLSNEYKSILTLQQSNDDLLDAGNVGSRGITSINQPKPQEILTISQDELEKQKVSNQLQILINLWTAVGDPSIDDFSDFDDDELFCPYTKYSEVFET